MTSGITLLSTAQLLDLLGKIYTNIESRIITIDPNAIILIKDPVDDKFYQTTLQAIQDGTDPVKGIEDNLTSDKVDFALSANQGRVLKSFVDDLNDKIGYIANELDIINNEVI